MRAALLLGAALMLSAAPAGALLSAPACDIRMSPDRAGPAATYHATLQVSPACPAAQVFRVRKSSSISLRSRGAPYQPIRPDGSARFEYLWSWSVSARASNVPSAELWSSTSWRWEVYRPFDESGAQGAVGVWQPIRSAWGQP